MHANIFQHILFIPSQLTERYPYFTQGVNDGAGALILASEEGLKQNNLQPLARLLGWSFVGVEPSIMGIGPVPAIQGLLSATNMSLNDIDLVEVSFKVNFGFKYLLTGPVVAKGHKRAPIKEISSGLGKFNS